MKTQSDDSGQVLLELSDLLVKFGMKVKRVTHPGHYPSDRLVVYLATENRQYAVNFWVAEDKLVFEAIVAQRISGDPAKVVLFYRWLLELNSTYSKLHYSSADTQRGQIILLRGSEPLERVDAHYLRGLLEEYHFVLTNDFEVLIEQFEELEPLGFISHERTLVTLVETGQEVLLLAGNDTTDAPPPNKKKKTRKEK